jgi:ribonuclease BN (tRNA processing enzyme)
MYDVGFGDCVLYQDYPNDFNAGGLLVDCGSKTDEEYAKKVLENELYKFKNLDMLITHFHDDHYNGFLKCNDISFSRVFLPKSYYKEGSGLTNTQNAFYIAVLSYALEYVLGRKKPLDDINDLFIKLPDLVNGKFNNIKCVGSGDIFEIEGREYNVLWPPKDFVNDNSTIKYDKIIPVITNMIRDNYKESKKYINFATSYANQFCEFYASLGEMDDNHVDDEEGEKQKKRLEELKNKHMDIVKLANMLNFQSKPKIDKKKLDSVDSSIIKNMNECSVVFVSDLDILALGDVDNKVIKMIKKIKKNSLGDHYETIKIQHHGTSSYWSKNIPKADNYLISNNGYKYIDWKIDKRYAELAANKTHVICTNTAFERCQYWKENMEKCSSYCRCEIKRNNRYIDF